jgi:hypothetical protein
VKINFSSEAKQDLRDGFHFYEQQESGLGIYFLESLYSDVDSLKIFSGTHEVHFSKYHRALSKRFPFAIYYTISGNIIDVHAVVSCRRNPIWLKNKLK